MTDGPTEPADHERDLIAERGVNEQYLRFLKALVARKPELKVTAPRNNIWTGRGPHASVSLRAVHPIYGRVALDPPDEDLTESFYIGTWYNDKDGVVVVSWAAPKAQLFFAGRDSTDELADDVRGRRSFVHRDLDLEDFVDDIEATADPSAVFDRSAAATLSVPEAPAIARPQVRRASQPERIVDQAPVLPTPERTSQDEAPYEPTDRRPDPGRTSAGQVRQQPLRAEGAVRAVLERPRTGHLMSVLSTLQPDQYRMVTWPDDRLLVVQGQPGTGKTIIATHRAAFLTHPERDGRPPLTRTLIVGPTDQYRSHVAGALGELGAAGVLVQSVPSLMRALVGISQKQEPEQDQRLDTSWALGRVVDQAARDLLRARRFAGHAEQDMTTLVNELVADTEVHRSAICKSAERAELSSWLLALKSFDNAARHAHALPFLACAALATRKLRRSDRFDHIVVDEAQDVRPLEWRILLRLLDDGASMSLFGDMNQRRSDWSIASWASLVGELDLLADTAGFEPELLTTGFRSTRQILRFANQLLRAEERVVHSIRDGVEPRIEKVPAAESLGRTIEEADRLAKHHDPGIVAVISISPKGVSDKLRSLGWSRGQLQHSWQRDGRTIIPLHPVLARGLEFDGVVVVEPGSFPQNLGREGMLYTSLTRATKELVVVHSQALPKGLRRPR
ncbi:MAG TPA: AAA family ATPase [Microthrixaceae bacterium]|nr:AAA family ATPase [Microthrixaceae bacterium]HNI34156.1 AAA family ATPase [Microthrixaceae bacterium]